MSSCFAAQISELHALWKEEPSSCFEGMGCGSVGTEVGIIKGIGIGV